MDRSPRPVDVKRIVTYVLLGSTLGMVFFVFYILLGTSEDDMGDEAPMWWRGNSYAGVVVDIDDRKLVLHPHRGDNMQFKIDGNTRFILRGNTRVQAGVEVKVLFRTIRSGDASFLLARTIKVLRTEAIRTSDGESPSATGSSQPTPGDAPSGNASSSPERARLQPSPSGDVIDAPSASTSTP